MVFLTFLNSVCCKATVLAVCCPSSLLCHHTALSECGHRIPHVYMGNFYVRCEVITGYPSGDSQVNVMRFIANSLMKAQGFIFEVAKGRNSFRIYGGFLR